MSRKKGTLWLLQFFSKFLLSVIPSLCFSQHYIDPNNLPQPTSAALALGRKGLQNLYPNLLALGILESLLITNSGLHARSKIPSSFPNVWNFCASQLLFEELRKVSKFTDFWNPHKSQIWFCIFFPSCRLDFRTQLIFNKGSFLLSSVSLEGCHFSQAVTVFCYVVLPMLRLVLSRISIPWRHSAYILDHHSRQLTWLPSIA